MPHHPPSDLKKSNGREPRTSLPICQRNENQDMGPQSEDLLGAPHTLKPSLYVPNFYPPNCAELSTRFCNKSGSKFHASRILRFFRAFTNFYLLDCQAAAAGFGEIWERNSFLGTSSKDI
jgi:hypothetical protein